MTVPELVKSMGKIDIARRNFFEMGINYLVSIFLSVFLWQSVNSLVAGYKCCPLAEWEGTMHLSEASSIHFYGILEYTNGTVHIAYSVPLQKIYLGMHLVQKGSSFPKATALNITQLYDFKKVCHRLL